MIDYAKITLRAGNGGRGITSFLREKYNPKGGPDGGDGGRGGDIIIRATNQLSTLLDFQYRKVFEAPHGQAGGPRNMRGKDGTDLVIEVPVGTVIKVNRIEREKVFKKQSKPDYDNTNEYKQIVINYRKIEKQKKYELSKNSANYHNSESDQREIIGNNLEVEEDIITPTNDLSVDAQTYPSWHEDEVESEDLIASATDREMSLERQKTAESGSIVSLYDNKPLAQICPTYDLTENGQSVRIAIGGAGGRGNAHFKSASHQAPQESERGQKGEIVEVEVQLKMIANVGMIGFPNAGKSTLLAALTSATPKIGNYPFTTLNPNLGVMVAESGERLVLADVPGLIEGAHEGKGLGIRFLKHIERTAVLVHVIALPDNSTSLSAQEVADEVLKSYEVIREELSLYKKDLENKDELLVINKIDLLPEEQRSEYINQLEEVLKQKDLHPIFISATLHIGTNGLKKIMLAHVSNPPVIENE